MTEYRLSDSYIAKRLQRFFIYAPVIWALSISLLYGIDRLDPPGWLGARQVPRSMFEYLTFSIFAIGFPMISVYSREKRFLNETRFSIGDGSVHYITPYTDQTLALREVSEIVEYKSGEILLCPRGTVPSILIGEQYERRDDLLVQLRDAIPPGVRKITREERPTRFSLRQSLMGLGVASSMVLGLSLGMGAALGEIAAGWGILAIAVGWTSTYLAVRRESKKTNLTRQALESNTKGFYLVSAFACMLLVLIIGRLFWEA